MKQPQPERSRSRHEGESPSVDPGSLSRQRKRFCRLLDALGARLVIYDRAGRVLHRTTAYRELGLPPYECGKLDRSCDVLARDLIAHHETAPPGRDGRLPRHRVRLERREFLLAASVLQAERPDPDPRFVVVVSEATDGHAVTDRFGLTPREAEVAELLARRQTNREIAETLGISRHTVRHHAERVFMKLGVHSRREVAGRLETDSEDQAG